MDSKYILVIALDWDQSKLLGDTLWSFTDSEVILEAQKRTELLGGFGPAAYYAVRANEAKIKGTLSISDLDVARFMLGFFLAQGWLANPPAILEPVIDRFMVLFPSELTDEWPRENSEPNQAPEEEPAVALSDLPTGSGPVLPLEILKADGMLYGYEERILEARQILAAVPMEVLDPQWKADLDTILILAFDGASGILHAADELQQGLHAQRLLESAIWFIRAIGTSLYPSQAAPNSPARRALQAISQKLTRAQEDITAVWGELSED